MENKDKQIYSMEAIGHRLYITRQSMAVSQVEFANAAGIPKNTYNQYERGKKRPSIENAIKLCERYDLTLDWIYRGNPAGLRYDLAETIRTLRNV